jgi:hypothetical protein
MGFEDGCGGVVPAPLAWASIGDREWSPWWASGVCVCVLRYRGSCCSMFKVVKRMRLRRVANRR